MSPDRHATAGGALTGAEWGGYGQGRTRAAARGARDRGHLPLRHPLRPALVPADDVAGAAGPAGADLPRPHGAAGPDARSHLRPQRDGHGRQPAGALGRRSTGRRSAARPSARSSSPACRGRCRPRSRTWRPATPTSSTTRTCRCRWPTTSPETTAIYLGERREDYPGRRGERGLAAGLPLRPAGQPHRRLHGRHPGRERQGLPGQGLQAERAGGQGRHRASSTRTSCGASRARSPTRSTPATASSGRSAGATRCRATTSSALDRPQAPAVRRADAAAGPAGGARTRCPFDSFTQSCGGPAFAGAGRLDRGRGPPQRPDPGHGHLPDLRQPLVRRRASRTRRSRSCTPTPTSRPRFVNRALSSPFQMGSTFKLVSTVAGLQSGIITPGSPYNDQGRYQIPNCDVAKFKCIFKNAGLARGSGPISLATALTISSRHVLLPHRRRAAAGPEPDAAERGPAVRLRLGQRHRPARRDRGHGARRRAEEAPGRAQPAGDQPGRGPGLLRRRQRAVRHRPGPAQRHPAPARSTPTPPSPTAATGCGR